MRKIDLDSISTSKTLRQDDKLLFFNGDAKDLLSKIPDNSIKLIVSSPPYNIGKKYERKINFKKYLENQDPIIDELYRVLSDNGSICWQVGNYVENYEVFPLDIYYYEIFKRKKLFLRNRIIWHFNHGLHSSRRFSGRYESILWFTKSDTYTFNLDPVRVRSSYPGKLHYKGPNKGKPSGNPKGKNPSDVWEILNDDWDNLFWEIPNVKANHPEKTSLPCQFPVELVDRCVLALTDENDWVLDPYAGSASTLISAFRKKRRAIGSERDNENYEIGKKRIEDLVNGKIHIREMTTPIAKPSGKVAQVPIEWENEEKDN